MDYYEIVVKGHIEKRIFWWFEDWEVTQVPSGETVIAGPVCDQAALYGTVARLRDLGLPLISVTKLDNDNQSTLNDK